MAWSLLTGKSLLLLVVTITMQSMEHRVAAYRDSTSLPLNCQRTCGNISVPYPFGIGYGCFRKGFEVKCDEEKKTAYLGENKRVKLLEINLYQGQVRVQNRISSSCHQDNNNPKFAEVYQPVLRLDSPYFTVSNTKNKFTAVGCATIAILYGQNENQLSGCTSFCNEHGIDNSTQCTGMGCCQASIPDNLKYLDALFVAANRINYSLVYEYSPCSYAFVVEKNWFNFSASYAKATNFRELYGANDTGVPMVLDWAVDSGTCEEAMKMERSYACISRHSECLDLPNALGYRCICAQGYQGNPYILYGCQDIDECLYPDLYPCDGKCINIFGGYNCSCIPGTQSKDPKTTPCTPIPDANQQTEVKVLTIGIFICSILVIVCISILLTRECQKRKLVKEKERLFRENGGPILHKQIQSRQIDTVILFTVEDLDTATNNFDKSTVLGTGGHGTVYKGSLSDQKVVAVKRSKVINMAQAEEFIQEIIVLSQINHRNVVRLLGCCLEVEVPMLVYEFIPNGTLFHLIHSKQDVRPPVSLEVRLRIAQESAEAIAFLHLSTNLPIVHGDVKSLNILLDENYMAKVTDFGASRMLRGADQCMTIVQGTIGYIDPEYFQERQLTEKSDVYSFGVVLLELITGKMAIYSEGNEEVKSLASSFILAMKEKRVGDMLDPSILGVGTEELLQEVAELGRQCLRDEGKERPSMYQVADKLKDIRGRWRELLLLLKHNETKVLIERPAVASADYLSASIYCTAPVLGMDRETPDEDHASTTSSTTLENV
ncbi:unnamed protein product [Urochloa decumbens]|uniref:Protein kinase domain-containing protein n=1 Tax=Urochloa decumbens TaxID=240449 RepID=A0ABC9DW61_9POAL